MSYPVRRQEITTRAKTMSTPDTELAAVWDQDPGLAVELAEVVNHGPTLERALRSGDFGLQRRVVASSGLRYVDPALLRGDLPTDVRKVLLRRLKKGRLPSVADALIDHVHDTFGAYEAARVLPGCSREVVARWLPRLRHLASSALAERHPDLVLDLATTELPALEGSARDDWWRHNTFLVDALVDHDPARVLDLIDRFGPSTWMPVAASRSGRLVRTDPAKFMQLILVRERWDLSKSGYRILARANPDGLAWLGYERLVPVLNALPPSRREAYFDAVHSDKDMSQVQLPEPVLRLLPRDRRAREARRMRAVLLAAGKEAAALQLAQHLPYDEATEIVARLTGSGDANDRARGYQLLIRAAAKDFRLTELLPSLATRLKREQDPVRHLAITALTSVSPHVFGNAPELTQLVTDALNARDLSPNTCGALIELSLKLLLHTGSEQALGLLADVWQRNSTLWFRLELRRGQEHLVYRAVAPIIGAAAGRKSYQPALILVSALRKRAWDMPDLLATIWPAITEGHEHEARQAIRLLLADRRTRDARVDRMIGLDPSVVLVPDVLEVVQARRTDLLDVLFAAEPPRGRFALSEVRQIPLLLGKTRRWLPSQRARYAELLTSLADDPGQERQARADAVRTLGAIHGQNARRYLDSDDELIAQAAIATLPDSDSPATALRLLVERALSGNRGQVELAAMYTIRRCARRVAPSVLSGVLAGIQGGPVSVRKEVVRLVSDFRLPDAMSLLTRFWHQDNQHRDVRAAIAYAALSWLDDPAAWDLLRTAVSGPREVAMQVLRVQTYSVPGPHRAAIGELIAEVATGPDTKLRALALQQLSSWLTWVPRGTSVLSTAFTDLDDRTSWEAAASGLAAAIRTPGADAFVLDSIRTLAVAAGPDAEADRDRPALQRIRNLLGRLRWGLNRRSPLRDTIIRLTDALTEFPEIRREVVELRLSTIRLDSPEAVADMRAIADLVADRPVLAAALGRRPWMSEHGSHYPWNHDEILRTARNVGNGYFAVGIVAEGGPRFGWSAEWRDLLRDLRRHPDPEVREAALQVTTASE